MYNREMATAYAKKWALSRNSRYYNFDALGGDCTNFVSQCLYSGCGEMNYKPDLGWYYVDLNNRSPAWTGVEELARFLTGNTGSGAKARVVSLDMIMVGDIVQLGASDGTYYHSLIVIEMNNEPLIAAHTDDAIYRPLSSYSAETIMCLHILDS